MSSPPTSDRLSSQDRLFSQHYLEDVELQLRKLKTLAERSFSQLDDPELFETLGGSDEPGLAKTGLNSVAILVQHLAGNMLSRWTDFLTTDGEKPDRHRDREFENPEPSSRESLMDRWESGWGRLFETLASLDAADLQKSVTVRGEEHTVLQAIQRQLSHYSYHVGQIVLLARHSKGDQWKWLSIPPGKSADFDVSREGVLYQVDGSGDVNGRS